MKKTFSFILMLSILLSPLLSYANTIETQPEKLTYEEALNIAIRRNTELQKNRLESRQAQESGQALNSTIDAIGVTNIPPDNQYNISKQATGINIQQDRAKKMEPFIIEGLKTSIKSAFNNIERLNNEISIFEKKLQFELDNRKLLSDQNRLGVISDVELNNQDKKIADMKATLKNKNISLEKLYYDLNKTLGVQYTTKIEVVPIEFTYEKITSREDILSFRITKALEKDIQIWMLENQIKLNEVDIAFSGYTSIPITSLSMEGKPAEVTRLENSIVYNNISEAKDNVRNQVINKRNSLKELELLIENNERILENLNEDKRLMNIRLQQGLIRPIDVSSLELSIQELKTLVTEQKRQYEFLKEAYLNPYMAGASF